MSYIPDLITGFIGNYGALSYFNPYSKQYISRTLPSTQFLSYCINHHDIIYCVDENYSEKGSSLYQFEFKNDDIVISDIIISDPNIMGAVFILEHDPFLYIPGFGSDNIWIMANNISHFIVPTCHKPHGIYFYEDIFYVPCRGDADYDANLIYRYKNNDLSIILSPIDLGHIQSNMGPRHLIFVNHFLYVVTEFASRTLRLDLDDMDQYLITSDNNIGSEQTGGEIRFIKGKIYVTIRVKNQPGYLVRYDTELNEMGRLIIGKSPRFFDSNREDDVIVVLNQDDQSFTLIDVQQWKIISTIHNLGISPQCFVNILHS